MMIKNESAQLRWVVLLLVTAVVLPTVCLLWFMLQAVRNERLAVRQKLIDVNRSRLELCRDKLDELWRQEAEIVKTIAEGSSDEFVAKHVYSRTARYAGCVIYGAGGEAEYPGQGAANEESPDSALESAWKKERDATQLEDALREYEAIGKAAFSMATRYRADLARVRCLGKLGRLEEAKTLCRKLAFADPETIPAESAREVLRARIKLAELYQQTNDGALADTLRELSKRIGKESESRDPFLAAPSSVKEWYLERMQEIAEKLDLKDGMRTEWAGIETVIGAERLAGAIRERYPSAATLQGWPRNTLRKLEWPMPFYGFLAEVDGRTVLVLFSWEQLSSRVEEVFRKNSDSSTAYRVYDPFGDFVCGEAAPEGEPIVRAFMGQDMPDWRGELFFRGGDVFEATARRQAGIYIWAGILVIVLILAVGAFSVRAVGQQIRLNRLKNDFIATVTHELKTPLSSMRVLVDTLREGRGTGPTQLQEYLELISRENDRLSRLIDNFLSFSRMERNKRSFAMERIDPAILARQAAEAVHAKYLQDNCLLKLELPERLPAVLADPDALITVLVNLLDNARKYNDSPDKRVTLKLFAEDAWVCFAVEDNGAGMNRRTMRRIFERFYQADTSLSRKTEGCGLGLSIVKYIVDAHQGRIEVKSQPGRGSVFTVRLRVSNGSKTVISW